MDLTALINGATSQVPAADQPRVLDFAEAPGLFVKSIFLPKEGSLVPQHSHKYGHLTMLAVGEIYVWKDGVPQGRQKAPASIYIPPHTKHTFATLMDNCLIYCIHRLKMDEQEPELLSEHEFNKG